MAPSLTDNIWKSRSQRASCPSSPSQHSTQSVYTFRYCAEANLLPDPDTLIHHRPNAFDDFYDDPDKDHVEYDDEYEEMTVDNMLIERVPSSAPNSPSNHAHSSSSQDSSSDKRESLFTPPHSSKPRKRVILDCVSVPPRSKGPARSNHRSSYDVPCKVPREGVKYASLGDALAAAFAQNQKSALPTLDRKGKRPEHEIAAPASKRNHKPRPQQFGTGVSTRPSAILNAHYPVIELDIPEMPEVLPCFDNMWQSNTHWIHLARFRQHQAELREGVPEMIARMERLANARRRQ